MSIRTTWFDYESPELNYPKHHVEPERSATIAREEIKRTEIARFELFEGLQIGFFADMPMPPVRLLWLAQYMNDCLRAMPTMPLKPEPISVAIARTSSGQSRTDGVDGQSGWGSWDSITPGPASQTAASTPAASAPKAKRAKRSVKR